MEVPMNAHGKKFYRIVLTGGPCGGKTTAQAVLTTVFETLGWKVYRTPEVATILLSGGVKNAEMTRADMYRFQENLMKTMLQIEQTYYDLAMTQTRDVLLVCDRGFMDAVAYLDPNDWEELKCINNWNDVDLRDKRYDHVIQMVTAADGAEAFYTTANNTVRSEPPELAIELDRACQRAWIGHPYFDVIDNCTAFPEKINRLVRCVATRMGLDLADRFERCSVKRKWLVTEIGPDSEFPKFEDFDVQHTYLMCPIPGVEARVRRRGKPGSVCSFQHTLRRNVDGRRVETRQQLTHRDFEMFVTQRDMDHHIVEMRRRCFIYNNQYFQLDMYQLPTSCSGLKILTTYAIREREIALPECLVTSKQEITDDPAYSMYNLTRKTSADDKSPDVEKNACCETCDPTATTAKCSAAVCHPNNHHPNGCLEPSPIPSMNNSQTSEVIDEVLETCFSRFNGVPIAKSSTAAS